MCGFTSGFQKGTLTTWTDNLSVIDVTDVCIYNVQCIHVTGYAVNSFFSAESICKRYYQIIELIFSSLYFQQLIADYVTPPQKELCRDLDAKIKPNIR